jgi:threonine synthase
MATPSNSPSAASGLRDLQARFDVRWALIARTSAIDARAPRAWSRPTKQAFRSCPTSSSATKVGVSTGATGVRPANDTTSRFAPECTSRRTSCSTICTTIRLVTRSLHVRLDDASAAALDVVRAEGLTDSEAVRTALCESAARRRVRSAIREEVRRVAADEDDREEMRTIREQMAELAPRSAR